MGAHFVVDHSKPLGPQLEEIGIPTINYVAPLTASEHHYPGIITVVAPEGTMGVIDDPSHIDVKPLKDNGASFHWEVMLARPKYETRSIIKQHELLVSVAEMIDQAEPRTTMSEGLGTINSPNLKKAHAMLESGRTLERSCLLASQALFVTYSRTVGDLLSFR